ncbi:TEGT family carrier/transport protein [Spiribacter salinus M19-40]|jgi:modulator of FtsH protease|uniref:TEGT family carrier/transport protein n=2 Tax=Spiribacter salinus TaxID=1335746 RepID=R4VL89_9GAMM|nr:Bax inhibitor-1/YccA family protein [Spiribacter salinus]MDR9414033.1 Bax inhibitor-1/YccA family protein [Spiribacter sp.]AGM41212.1 TEGT family carrier/transport protein [Spiribacter salinus M19-40]MBY5268449.1 BAX inhibitor protein [Spiribacter salinus]MDR9455649.1 Bax inhibitor-1/YccA family protein [Spiribacter sp.]TQF00574.1 MAG: Bax inhibitor-1/YccA family protein [Spiribacter salinus]
MAQDFRTATVGQGSAAGSVLSTNKVLRNTYALLAMTLLFSASMAGVAMATNAPPMHWLLVLGGYFGLLFLTTSLRNSIWGLASVFALTGFMGFTLGPIVSLYLSAFSNGAELVMMALGGTGVTFLGLSAYALTSQRDFSFMRGFIFAGVLVAFAGAIIAIIFSVPALSLAVSAAFVVLMSALILYQTSEIIHGGETNYIMATITLYVTIYNLFLSLLQLLAAFAGER